MIDELKSNGINLNSYAKGNHKTTCPQCSHTRRNKKDRCLSVTINDNHAVWKCHNCSWAGSAGQWYNKRERKEYRRPEPLQGTETDKLYNWFESRCISKATVDRAGVKFTQVWMPQPNKKVWVIAFPFTRDGELINVKYRTSEKGFRQEKDAEPIYFGMDFSPSEKQVVVCEGEVDAMSLWECGYNAVSVPDGAPNQEVGPDSSKFDFFGNCIDWFDGKEIIIAADADKPGQVLELELSRRFGKGRCKRVRYPEGCKDFNDVLKKYGPDGINDTINSAEPFPLDGVHAPMEYMDQVYSLYRNGRSRGMSTGWAALDEHLTVRVGDQWVVTGVPNHGKSEWLDALSMNLCENHGFVFGVASFENMPDEHIAKMVEKHTRKPFWDGPIQRITEGELDQALSWINRHYRFIRMDGDDSPEYSWILERAKETVQRDGMNALIIDPYNELAANRGDKSETDFISQMLGDTRRFCQNFDVTTFWVAHPQKLYRNNDGTYNPPSLYDIAGSANWNNKCDVGVVVHRDFENDETELFVRKVRRKEVGKAGGSQRFKWQSGSGTFRDIYPNEVFTK